ncbi:MAG: RIP metalloprotease RseP [Candidatus Puniceispirillum sp.]|nr:RIP metalloprotease RseP [Candidatus Puniceispirillum sp.]MBL6775135.1 RIP metalloprotease RseP [Candidatus Puniceispirillum sp.]
MPDLGFTDLILGFLLLITPVVYFHELGHYWVARKAGVVVDVFSIGFGPEIYGWTAKTGTRWRISAIPLGGYVKMRGDDDAASTPSETGEGVVGSFSNAGLYWRMAIVAAGPIANFILGILLFAIVYMSVGKQVIPAVIGDVIPNMPAASAGLKPGDKVVEIDGIGIRDFKDMRGLVLESPNKTINFIIERDGRNLSLNITPAAQFNEQLQIDIGILGVKSPPVGEFQRLGPSAAIMAGASDAFHMSIVILRSLARAVTGNMQQGEVGGPVRIAEISGAVLNQGIVPFILLTAVISINLGLINLLPIPALDGGHLTFFMLEALRGKPLPLGFQAALMRGGIAILMGLTLFLVVIDVVRLFQ